MERNQSDSPPYDNKNNSYPIGILAGVDGFADVVDDGSEKEAQPREGLMDPTETGNWSSCSC